jgi:hypothetical protein
MTHWLGLVGWSAGNCGKSLTPQSTRHHCRSCHFQTTRMLKARLPPTWSLWVAVNTAPGLCAADPNPTHCERFHTATSIRYAGMIWYTCVLVTWWSMCWEQWCSVLSCEYHSHCMLQVVITARGGVRVVFKVCLLDTLPLVSCVQQGRTF